MYSTILVHVFLMIFTYLPCIVYFLEIFNCENIQDVGWSWATLGRIYVYFCKVHKRNNISRLWTTFCSWDFSGHSVTVKIWELSL